MQPHPAVGNTNFLLEIDFRLNPLKQVEFNHHLNGLRRYSACDLGPAVYENIDSPGNLLFVFGWTKRTVLDAYLDSDTFRVLVGGMETLGVVSDYRILDLSSEAPERGKEFELRKRGLDRGRVDQP